MSFDINEAMFDSGGTYLEEKASRVTGSKMWRDASHFASQEFPPHFAFTF